MAVSHGLQWTQVVVPPLPRDTPRRWERAYVQGAIAADALAAGTASAVAVSLGARVAGGVGGLAAVSLLPLGWVAAIALAGGYQRRFLGFGSEEFRRVALGGLAFIAVVGFIPLATLAQVGRTFALVALPAAIILTWTGRYLIRQYVYRMRTRGAYLSRTLIVGDATPVSAFAALLRADPSHGYEVLGACVPTSSTRTADREIRVIGTLDTIVDAVVDSRADSVIVLCSPEMTSQRLRRLAWDLEPTGANLVLAPPMLQVAGSRLAVRPVGDLPLLYVEQPRLTGPRRLVKSVYEPVAATAALALLSPVLLAIALAIKIDSPGPVFFRQARVGRLGRPFMIVKFRSMVADADRRKKELAHLDVGAGPLFKVHSDPRVTRVGAFLRRTSLDELPQLFNVVLGQMSLVGPRPHLLEEIALFGEDFTRRLFVKPGLTGLWQVSGRSDLTAEESVRLDLRYIENWSLTLDVSIMWKTLGVMINRSGAY